ncbi:6796_t:CDS:2, partial [Dentiscutata erythropus]
NTHLKRTQEPPKKSASLEDRCAKWMEEVNKLRGLHKSASIIYDDETDMVKCCKNRVELREDDSKTSNHNQKTEIGDANRISSPGIVKEPLDAIDFEPANPKMEPLAVLNYTKASEWSMEHAEGICYKSKNGIRKNFKYETHPNSLRDSESDNTASVNEILKDHRLEHCDQNRTKDKHKYRSEFLQQNETGLKKNEHKDLNYKEIELAKETIYTKNCHQRERRYKPGSCYQENVNTDKRKEIAFEQNMKPTKNASGIKSLEYCQQMGIDIEKEEYRAKGKP